MINYFGDFTIFYIINIILAIAIIFMERKDPTATLAWVLVLLVLPGLGFILYLFLSQNFNRNKLFSMKKNAKRTFGDFLNQQQYMFDTNSIKFKDENILLHKDIIKMNLFRNQSFFTQDNKVKIYTDGNNKFSDLFSYIESARSSIHILYYIIKSDELGMKLINLLTKKVEEGVEVRLLYDSIGGRELNKKVLERLVNLGGKVGEFFPGILPHVNFKVNYRNHRKIVIIDGKIGFIGGFNVGNEYVGRNKKFGYWRDTHLKIEGLAVAELQRRFFLDWGNATKEELSYNDNYFPNIENNTNDNGVGIQIVSSGPEEKDEIIKQNYVKLINSAKKSILIQTPYFAPDESVMEAIKIAAISGVDVKIMIPNKPDHLFVYWATYFNVGLLLKYGVKIFRYEKGFLHAKTIVIDGIVSSVGTANFDVRSFKLNFEIIALLYNTEISKMLSNTYYNDIRDCKEITEEVYEKRGFIIRIKEAISRLLSPLL